MNEQHQHHDAADRERLDAATSARLAKLGAMPVDVSGLQAKLRQAMAAERGNAMTPAPRTLRFMQWRRTITGVAAAIIVAGLIGVMMLSGGNAAAIAAPADMAKLHTEVSQDIVPTMHAHDVAEANELLAAQRGGTDARPLPQSMPGQMHACCLRSYAGVSLSCVMLEWQGKLISVAVADADHMRSPQGQTVERDGRQFVLHAANGVNMVMTSEAGRWLCVMGDVSNDQLLDVATQIHF